MLLVWRTSPCSWRDLNLGRREARSDALPLETNSHCASGIESVEKDRNESRSVFYPIRPKKAKKDRKRPKKSIVVLKMSNLEDI